MDKRIEVRCIDDSNSDGYLELGKVYPLDKEIPGSYFLREVEGSWCKSRFEIVEEDEGMVKNCKTCAHYDECIWKSNSCWSPKEPVAEENGTVTSCNSCRWDDEGACLLLVNPFTDCIDESYKYLEKSPKQLKKMTFGEAFKHFKNIKGCCITAIETGMSWYYFNKLFEEVSDKEIEGLWTASEVYEDA